MQAQELAKWAGAAERGERITYHIGHLATDRGIGKEVNAPLVELSNTVMKLVGAEIILVAQKRIAEDKYEYIAISNKPRSALRRSGARYGRN